MLEYDYRQTSTGRMMEVVKSKPPRELTLLPPLQQQLGIQETMTYSAALPRALAANRNSFCERVTEGKGSFLAESLAMYANQMRPCHVTMCSACQGLRFPIST